MVIVATDDRRIFDAVESFGGKAVMTREDHVSGTDRIAEAFRVVRCLIGCNLRTNRIEPAGWIWLPAC